MDRSLVDFYRLKDILQAMIATRRQNQLAYQKYSALLISDKRDKVITYTMKALVASFDESVEDSDQVFEGVDSIPSFFINLCREYPWIICHELSHTDPRRRYQMVLILRSIFKLKEDFKLKGEFLTVDICRELITEELKEIWLRFLELFTDSESEIRIVCVEITEVLLQTQIDERIVSTIVENLKKRLRDLDSIIRKQSTLVIENCNELENILDRNLMKHFVARIGDTDLEVRQRVQIAVANVFNTIRKKYCKSLNHYFFKLSTACLLQYNYTDLEGEKAWMEEIFRGNLIDNMTDMSTKMLNLLQLICYSDDIGVQTIAKIFRNQLIVRTLFAKILVSSKRHDFQLSIIFSNRNAAQSLKKKFEYIDKIKELLVDFHLLLKDFFEKDNEKYEQLLNIFMCKAFVTKEESDNVIEEFFAEEETVVELQAFTQMKDYIRARTGVGLIDVQALIQLFQHMDTIDVSFINRLVSFVALLSKCYSDYFTDQSVIDAVLNLPPIVLTRIASDSVIQYMNFTDILKENIAERVAETQSLLREESDGSSTDISESSL